MKKFIEKIKDVVFTICHPNFWIMIHPYDKEWEDEFFKSVEDNGVEIINDCRMKIGTKIVWIGNYPYSCFVPHDLYYSGKQVRISRRNIHKMWRHLKQFGCPNVNKYNSNFWV